MHGGCRRVKLPEKTASAIIAGNADYLLCAKDNQGTLKKDIEDYVPEELFQKGMEREKKTEKSRDKIEKRTAYITDDIVWHPSKEEWKGIKCIRAVHTEFDVKGQKTDEWLDNTSLM